MRIKDDRNDSSTKEVLSAFPKDNISQDIKDTAGCCSSQALRATSLLALIYPNTGDY